MTAVPKPTRKPRSVCPLCAKQMTARAALRHRCGRSKYGAKRTVTKSGAYPSRLESRTHQHLLALVAAGFYAEVRRYPSVTLIPGVTWKVDFVCTYPNGDLEYVEAKGVEGERYKILLQLWRELGEAPLRIFKADRRGEPVQAELIIPRRMGA